MAGLSSQTVQTGNTSHLVQRGSGGKQNQNECVSGGRGLVMSLIY